MLKKHVTYPDAPSMKKIPIFFFGIFRVNGKDSSTMEHLGYVPIAKSWGFHIWEYRTTPKCSVSNLQIGGEKVSAKLDDCN